VGLPHYSTKNLKPASAQPPDAADSELIGHERDHTSSRGIYHSQALQFAQWGITV
jgi:hypothetical protein